MLFCFIVLCAHTSLCSPTFALSLRNELLGPWALVATLIARSCAQSGRVMSACRTRSRGEDQLQPPFKCADAQQLLPPCCRPAAGAHRLEPEAQRGIMGLIRDAVDAVGGLIVAVTSFLTDRFLTPPLRASLAHLEETELRTLTGGA